LEVRLFCIAKREKRKLGDRLSVHSRKGRKKLRKEEKRESTWILNTQKGKEIGLKCMFLGEKKENEKKGMRHLAF